MWAAAPRDVARGGDIAKKGRFRVWGGGIEAEAACRRVQHGSRHGRWQAHEYGRWVGGQCCTGEGSVDRSAPRQRPAHTPRTIKGRTPQPTLHERATGRPQVGVRALSGGVVGVGAGMGVGEGVGVGRLSLGFMGVECATGRSRSACVGVGVCVCASSVTLTPTPRP